MASPWENLGAGSAQSAPHPGAGFDANARQVAEAEIARRMREFDQQRAQREAEQRDAEALKAQQNLAEQQTLLAWHERLGRTSSMVFRNTLVAIAAGTAAGLALGCLIGWLGRDS